MVGLQIERHLQVEDAHADAALVGEELAKAVEDLGHALLGRVDHQGNVLLARLDLIAESAHERMRVLLRAVRETVEDGARELVVALVRGVTRVGERGPQHAAVLPEATLIGGAGLLLLAGNVGDQRLVIVEIELRAFGLLRLLELSQCLGAVAGGKRRPAARERARQLADQTVACGLELLVGLLVVARLEAIEPEHEVRHAVGRILGDELLGQEDRARPVRLRGFRLEGLL